MPAHRSGPDSLKAISLTSAFPLQLQERTDGLRQANLPDSELPLGTFCLCFSMSCHWGSQSERAADRRSIGRLRRPESPKRLS